MTDSNGVLFSYKVTSDGGLTISESGNILTLSTASEINETAHIQLARPGTGSAYAVLHK